MRGKGTSCILPWKGNIRKEEERKEEEKQLSKPAGETNAYFGFTVELSFMNKL